MSDIQRQLCGHLETYLPVFMGAMNSYQYKQAKQVVPGDIAGLPSWKSISTLLHVWADCDSTYHEMTYLRDNYISTETLRVLYVQLKTQSIKCAEILQPSQREKSCSDSGLDALRTSNPVTPVTNGNPRSHDDMYTSRRTQNTDIQRHRASSNNSEADINHEGQSGSHSDKFTTFFEQCSAFFEQRLLMVSLYLNLARQKPFTHYLFDFNEKCDILSEIISSLQTLNHPLLLSARNSSLHESQTVHAGVQCEVALSQYDCVKSIITLHSLKRLIETWVEELDSVIEVDDFGANSIKESQIAMERISIEKCPQSPPVAFERKPSFSRKPLKRSDLSSSFSTTSSHSLTSSLATNHLSVMGNSGECIPSYTSISTVVDDGIELQVFRWSRRFMASLSAKFKLYFFRWLEPYDLVNGTLLSSMPSDSTAVEVSYFDALGAYFSKTFGRESAPQLSIVVDTSSLPNGGASFHTKGYLCPTQIQKLKSSANPNNHLRAANKTYFGQVSRYDEDADGEFTPLWGIGSWPPVFNFPNSKMDLSPSFIQRHWPNLIMLMLDLPSWSVEGAQPTKSKNAVSVHHERRMNVIYAVGRIDPCVYLTVVFEKKKQNIPDKALVDLVSYLLDNLQHANIFRSNFP
ncbi:hypothetical protein Ae201684_009145 [Aphanomyces euteiches]|uniref:Uncharacterized protein n=1 Tax=Aphanomyces euteiches TaxID=100861 RepID=A0A6G0X248_9STRA|nr:hypothetical protein Ae201684_009145 [Aphanomyces euteiches]